MNASVTAKANGPEQQRPFTRTPEEMNGILERLDRSGFDLSQLDAYNATVSRQKELAGNVREAVRQAEPSANGNLDLLVDDLVLYKQEIDKKERWYEKLGRYAKEAVTGTVNVVTAPFRWTWQVFKKYPILSTLVVIAIAIGGAALKAYLTGNLEVFLQTVGQVVTQQIPEALKRIPIEPTGAPPVAPPGPYFAVPPPG